ncbi:MAG TPA: T9SS type A sorting domain-containing protein [Bacteroidia bacterium]|nr:T9SS type A sorting domain-containing protein [Bacteroidia bacterium]
MKKHLHIILFLLSISTTSFAGSGGPDAYGYIWKDNLDPQGPVYNWIDIVSKPGRVLVERLSDDNTQGPFQINFDFHYYWYDVHQFWVGSNGYIAFQSCQLSVPFPFIPSTSQPQDYIAAMAADLNFDGAGNPGQCYYWSSPNHDSLVVSWLNVPFWDQNAPSYQGSNSFQLILSTIDSSITFQYQQQTGVYGGGNSPYLSAGIENINGGVGLQSMINPAGGGAGYFITPYAVKFTYPPTSTFQALDASTLYNDNPTNGARFISNLTPDPWEMNSEIKNAGNVNLNPFNVYSYVATSASGFTGTIEVDDTITTTLLVPQATASLNMGETFSPVFDGTYIQVTRTLVPGDIAPSNDSASLELVVVDTTNTPIRLSYDDGFSNGVGLNWLGGQGGAGVQFVPPFYPCKLTSVHAYITSNPNLVGFYMAVFDDNGPNGSNGTKLDSVYVDALSYTAPVWVDIPLTNPIVINSGSFYVSWNMDGVGIILGNSVTGPFSNRTFEVLGNAWAIYRNREIEDLMINATIDTVNIPVGIASVDTKNSVSQFYPNPAATSSTISLEKLWTKYGSVGLQLYSADGKLLYEDHPSLRAGLVNQISVDVTSLKSGMYYCRIFSESETVTRSIQVIH